MIKRARRPSNFTIISNVGMNDERLSLKAKGLLAYLLTKPDNWQVSDRQLSTIGPDGRSAVQAALKELEEYKYLVRRKVRAADGTLHWESTIYDEPWPDFPATEKPATVYPATEKPATENQAIINTVAVKTVRTSTDKNKNSTNNGAASVEFSDLQRPAPYPTAEDRQNIFQALQSAGVYYNALLGEMYEDLAGECGAGLVVDAIQIAVRKNKQHHFDYVAAIARNRKLGKGAPIKNGAALAGVDAVQFNEGQTW